MYYLVRRDKRRRNKILNQEWLRKVLKSIWKNRTLSFEVRYLIFLQLKNLNIRGNAVCAKNRCFLTGRGRSVLREFHLSRLQFRDKARDGNLPGVKQSSW